MINRARPWRLFGQVNDPKNSRDAQVRAAEARLVNARADLTRATQLVQGRTISRAEFDSVEAAYRVAQEYLKVAVQMREKGQIGRKEELLTGMPFGFMALLGVLSVGGEQIKNQIVVLSKILTDREKGKTPYQAILDGCVSKMRPVCMVAITTVLGMIPLLADPFFGALAVCIMFGLSFAAVLALIVTPVLYAIFFRFHEPLQSEALPSE